MRRKKEASMKLRILAVVSCLLLSAASSFAQTAPDKTPDVSTEMRNGFNEVNDWVMKAADMVPADKYSYRPVDTVRTFGQLIAVGRCNAAYSSGNAQLRPLFTNIGHTSLHYGNIITYMRMMGLKPPSS
jgi:hypothetical protein